VGARPARAQDNPTGDPVVQKIYDVNPKFDLTPAEAGHPSWTRTFASAKAQALKAQKDKEAQKKGSQPPTAGVKQ